MPTKNPRINVVLEDSVYDRLRFLAKRDGVSLSTKARDLIREAIEVQEDVDLTGLAEDRESSWGTRAALSHEEIWS